jgi:hypothetical protein
VGRKKTIFKYENMSAFSVCVFVCLFVRGPSAKVAGVVGWAGDKKSHVTVSFAIELILIYPLAHNIGYVFLKI